MIFQKSFEYADLVHKTVVLLNIFVETVIFFPGIFDEYKDQNKRIDLKYFVTS